MMKVDRDYVYVYGPEWADELLDAIERDPLAQVTMAENGLTRDDLRSYYLVQPHFDRIYCQLLDSGDDFVHDPVDALLQAVKTTKETAESYAHDVSPDRNNERRFHPLANRNRFGQVNVRGKTKVSGIRNPVALFVRLIMS
jgi:hypothetical protein